MDPAYLLAKSFAEKGALFEKRFYEELIESPHLAELVNALRATKYSNELSKISPPYSSLKIEQALRRSLIETHFKFHRLMRKHRVLNVLYDRYMVRNLKSIYRGIAAGKTYEELMKLIDLRAEELMGIRDIVIKAMTAGSLKESVDVLQQTAFGEALREAYQLFEKTSDPTVFELRLEKAMMKKLFEAIKKSGLMDRKHYYEIFYPMIDSFIITGILRMKLWGLSSSECRKLMEGVKSRLPKPLIELLYESNKVGDILKGLELNKKFLPKFTSHPELTPLIKELEDGFYRIMITNAKRVFMKTRSSKVLVVASLILKENEVSNLVAIATGIESRMPAERIIDKLFIP